MTSTRIAGQSFDARHATQVAQLARVWDYARHIRNLARQATRAHVETVKAHEPSRRYNGQRTGTARAGTLLPSA